MLIYMNKTFKENKKKIEWKKISLAFYEECHLQSGYPKVKKTCEKARKKWLCYISKLHLVTMYNNDLKIQMSGSNYPDGRSGARWHLCFFCKF